MTKIVKDLRVLKHFTIKYDLHFDKDYKYCINSGWDFDYFKQYNYKNKTYKLKFFDGCFEPFLCEV